MTWEAMQKCRFYPNCMIHTGEPRPHVMSDENVREIRALAAQGEPLAWIAQEFGISERAVSHAVYRTHYQQVS